MIRLYFSFETLRYPDYPADLSVVNRNELLELDQLLAWCVQYGVHLQISMSGYLGSDGSLQAGMPENEEEWAITRDHWQMLAKRYAGISSRYLTFDLANEIQPEETEAAMDAAERGLSSVVEAIRQADSDRVLLYSLAGGGSPESTERFTPLAVAVGCPPHTPNFLALRFPEPLCMLPVQAQFYFHNFFRENIISLCIESSLWTQLRRSHNNFSSSYSANTSGNTCS